MLPPSPFLYPIIDADFSDRIIDDSREALRAGAKIVQLRAKRLPKRVLFDAVIRLCPVFAEKKALLIVNDYVDIVMTTETNGVHVGQDDLALDVCRTLLPKKVIGFSTHNVEQAAVADELPVDYIAIGPIHRTLTKVDADPWIGLPLLKRVRETTRHPLVAIGGIRSEHIPDLLNCGVDGIALISELYRDGSIYDRVSRLLELIHESKSGLHPDNSR
jgi:thiamine-phosphate pyrophosphorylase